MKVIGFWSKHDGDIILPDYLSEPHILPEIIPGATEVDRIVDYIDNGIPMLSLTLGIMVESKHIGAYRILCDGEWVWPSHLSYYVKNGDYRFLTKEFVNYILHSNGLPDRKVIDDQREKLNNYVRGILNIKMNKQR